MITGTESIGLRAPLIKEGDNIVDIVVKCIYDYSKETKHNNHWRL